MASDRSDCRGCSPGIANGGNVITHEPRYSHAGWLKYVLRISELRETINRCLPVVEKYQFDALAFRGMSGALIAPILALELTKSLIMVRKPEQFSHSSYLVEGDRGANSYLIVDDFVANGETIKEIIRQVKGFATEAKCIGVLEVNHINDPDQAFNTPYFIERRRNDVTLINPMWITRVYTGEV